MPESSQKFVAKLSDHLQKNNALEKICQLFFNVYDLQPVIGVEIEFYLSNNINAEKFASLINYTLKPEKGYQQYEIDLLPQNNLLKLITDINQAKLNLSDCANKLNGFVDFRSKPFLDDYGNSMHIHVSFKGQLENYNLELAARSLCHYMLETFLIFAPNPEDYYRFKPGFMAPTHISYGGNNRTVALRIPDSLPRRIEHRLSSPETNPYLAIFTILKSIWLGLNNPDSLSKHTKIHGNAYDIQYNLKSLPQNIEEAASLFNLNFYK